jgi:hypothetical protein
MTSPHLAGSPGWATNLPNYHLSPLASPSDGWLNSKNLPTQHSFPSRPLPYIYSKSVSGYGIQFSGWGPPLLGSFPNNKPCAGIWASLCLFRAFSILTQKTVYSWNRFHRISLHKSLIKETNKKQDQKPNSEGNYSKFQTKTKNIT